MNAVYNQVKIFTGKDSDVEALINKWIVKNAITDIVSITAGGSHSYNYVSVTILYKTEINNNAFV